MAGAECALLYSGGSDSTCAAALMAERHERVHLLTFEDLATRGSPAPSGNVERLRAKYGVERFVHALIPVDRLLERISYERYWANLRRHGLYMAATPGFSSLCWHVRTIAYCLDRGIRHAADGVTREFTHFPGHQDAFLRLARALYADFGITYENPVRDWETPPEKKFLDALVSTHGFEQDAAARPRRTTGAWLYEHGLMPAPDVKGSHLDQSMQHSCYPFVLFNIFVFWYCLAYRDRAHFERRCAALFADKFAVARGWLEDYRARGPQSTLAGWLEG